jgi:hypothetical protein
MKETIKTWIIATFAIFASSLICYIVYQAFLLELFEHEVSYMQWVAIHIIRNLLFTKTPIQEKKNESKGTKIPRDIFTHGI